MNSASMIAQKGYSMTKTKDCSNCYYYRNVDPFNPEPIVDCTWLPDESNNYGEDGRACDGEEEIAHEGNN
ncbi:MAG: hypothetical protein J6A59_18255 [Lachnospiraceae bacterium]|nr:hypothetical protein [Lachnospiraceae bacterium]